VQAMRDALAHLRAEGIPFDAPWGSLQVAGDDGAPPIPIGGGDATAGNANAIASDLPGANLDHPYPVSYGSSHIQAVAFQARGRVQASTILTYSQSTDPTSPFSSDQTALFGEEQWVRFPFTSEEIAADRIGRRVVSAP